MSDADRADALVVYGATCDLAYKKIFPSLQQMIRRCVDPAIRAGAPVHPYEPGTWGPKEADGMVPGGWFVAEH